MSREPIFGTTNDDRLTGTEGRDILSGLAGNDYLYSGGGDVLDGGEGDDSLYGGGTGDRLLGGDGNDSLYAFSGGENALRGGAGNDYLYFYGPGPGTGSGDAGDDWFYLGLGVDGLTLDGGEGHDVVRLYGWDVVPEEDFRLDLSGPVAMMFRDGKMVGRFSDVEQFMIATGNGDDRIIGSAGSDVLEVGAGANRVQAGGGDDDVFYQVGQSNELDGGEGKDTLVVLAAEAPLRFDALSGTDEMGSRIVGFEIFSVGGSAGDDRILLGDGDDGAAGQDGDDHIDGRGGSDVLVGYAGRDHLLGGDGDDYLLGGLDADRLEGGAGADYLKGDEGDDTLSGGAGDDFLYCDDGSDLALGGEGDDWMIADYGVAGPGDDAADALAGGSGRDRFEFRLDGEADRVLDFQHGEDVISLRLTDGWATNGNGVPSPSQFSVGVAVGTHGQIVLLKEGADDLVVWDANGTDEGGVSRLVVLAGDSGLTAEDVWLAW